MKNILGLNLLLILLFSCNEKSTKKENTTNKITENKTLKTIVDTAKIQRKETEKWGLIITKIDSAAFIENKQRINPKKDSFEKIKDFQIAKEMLKGKVKFGGWNDKQNRMVANDKGEFLVEILDAKTHKFKKTNDYFGFIAYYPDLDILLCEGGHTTDVSFNLTTGEETEKTGNPDYIISSKNKSIRLNSYFEGQECYSSFIQKEINGKFEKIIQLDEEFEKLTKQWLCTIGESFWSNDTTLFLEETDNPIEGNSVSYYYKIELIKK